MKYQNIIVGEFVSRPNRFIAKVKIDGCIETVHVKNTGRCSELLVDAAKVYLEQSFNPNRKTKYDLIAVEKKRENDALLINMDSQIPNDVVFEWLTTCGMFSELAHIRREVIFGSSRFDLYISDGNRKAFVEVKGVTLEHDGVAMFPDAPTQRGVKHIRELIFALDQGYEAYLIFLIQMKGVYKFCPNEKMHPEFANALKDAQSAGVKIMAMDCMITPDCICCDKEIPIEI